MRIRHLACMRPLVSRRPNREDLKPACKPNNYKQFLFLLRQLELARWQI